jgi:hypothetical protein
MKTVDLGQQTLDLEEVIKLARHEPVLLLARDGTEFCIAEADDFDKEVEMLRQSPAFQRFLDDRAGCAQTIPLEEIETELEKDLAGTQGIQGT